MRFFAVAGTVVYYFGIVFFGTVLLAAAQLRSATGSAYDTWRLNYEANVALTESLDTRIRVKSEQLRDHLNGVTANEGCLRLFDARGVARMNLLDRHTVEQVEEARRRRSNPNEVIGDANCVFKGISWVKHDIQHYKGLAETAQADLAELQKALAASRAQYAELVKDRNDHLAFKQMEKVWYLKPFVLAPYDLLVLLLVVFMGGLGGMVRLLRDYGVSDKRDPIGGEYFFIPLIGAVVAVGGYILAMTGLLLLSSARTDSSLSPYMISLVGIVSGLLAREVIDTLSARGRKMLSGPQPAQQNG